MKNMQIMDKKLTIPTKICLIRNTLFERKDNNEFII